MYFGMALQLNMNIKLIFYESVTLYHKLPYTTIHKNVQQWKKT